MTCLLFPFRHAEQDQKLYYPTYSCRSKALPPPEQGKFVEIFRRQQDGTGKVYLVSIRKLRMGHERFSIRKLGIFCPDKEIKGLRGGVLLYVAQARPMIDAARATIRLHRIGQHLLPAG